MGAKWIDSFPCPLLLSLPLDNKVVARKIGHPLSANSNNIFSAIWSQIPWELSSFKEDHFFSEPGPTNDRCPFPNLLAYSDTSRAFARISCSLSLVPQGNVVEHRHEQNSSCEFFSLVSPNLLVNLWLYHRAATYWILGKYPTINPLARRRFCQSFCILKTSTIPIFTPMLR